VEGETGMLKTLVLKGCKKQVSLKTTQNSLWVILQCSQQLDYTATNGWTTDEW
jgi:hypothetical protein